MHTLSTVTVIAVGCVALGLAWPYDRSFFDEPMGGGGYGRPSYGYGRPSGGYGRPNSYGGGGGGYGRPSYGHQGATWGDGGQDGQWNGGSGGGSWSGSQGGGHWGGQGGPQWGHQGGMNSGFNPGPTVNQGGASFDRGDVATQGGLGSFSGSTSGGAANPQLPVSPADRTAEGVPTATGLDSGIDTTGAKTFTPPPPPPNPEPEAPAEVPAEPAPPAAAEEPVVTEAPPVPTKGGLFGGAPTGAGEPAPAAPSGTDSDATGLEATAADDASDSGAAVLGRR